MKSKLCTAVLASSLASLLTACGGGGSAAPSTSSSTVSGSAGGGATSPPTAVVSATGTLQTSVAAPGYATNSTESSAYAALNAARQGAGAGLLAQNAQLDVAAAAHARYLSTNIASTTDFHIEDASKVDFYAASAAERVTKAGYLGTFVTEAIGGTGPSLQGADCVLGLLNTVYHAAALLSPSTQVGLGAGTDGVGMPMCVIDLGVASSTTHPQVAAAGSLTAYPYDRQMNLSETFYVGYEVPRPSAALLPSLTAGTPVVVNVRNADYVNAQAAGTLAVVVTAFNLKDAGGNTVPVAILANPALTAGSGVTLSADSKLSEGFAVLVPLSSLAKGSTYTATFTATLRAGGTPVTKTWAFVTNP